METYVQISGDSHVLILIVTKFILTKDFRSSYINGGREVRKAATLAL
jgi:hypothetical protein